MIDNIPGGSLILGEKAEHAAFLTLSDSNCDHITYLFCCRESALSAIPQNLMKITTRSIVYLSAATMVLIVTLTVPAVAQNQVPFKGAIQGYEIDKPQGGPPPTTVSVSGSTTGIASHVGRLSFNYELTVTLLNRTATGSGQLIAANGDIIYTTILGLLVPTGTPGVASITETDTITGGTGRFVGAQGSFMVERLLDQRGPNPHLTSGSFQGTITPPGAAQ
jgi:hypothetical protein